MNATVRLPWPPAATSPNAKGQGKWRRKSDAARSYKTTCAWECALAKVTPMDADEVEVTVTFCPPSARRFDLDNALAGAKQGLDAFAEAIGVDDGRWTSMTLERGEPMRGGAVFVTATPAANTWQSIGSVALRLQEGLRHSAHYDTEKSGAGGATNANRPLTITDLAEGGQDGC